ncbi:MAG: hypothetical protein HGB14_02435 [Anaerolineaceae bacterium]|nr:hypothetical protein [Anaerolineaceae bacterium]
MKTNYSDRNLRPAIDLNSIQSQLLMPDLFNTIQKLSRLKRTIPALSHGEYEQALVNSKQFGFWRCTSQQKVLVLINTDQQPFQIRSLPIRQHSRWYDPIGNENQIEIVNQQISITIPPHAYRIIVFE